jgi:hypothetical protein
MSGFVRENYRKTHSFLFGFSGFLNLKYTLKKMIFDNIITIQEQSHATPAEFRIQDFCKCFQQWHD